MKVRTPEERKTLESNIAPEVANYLGDGWTTETSENGLIHLVRAGGEKLDVCVKHVTGQGDRLVISGDTTVGNTYIKPSKELRNKTNEITLSLDKTYKQIAEEIARRLLPSYRELLADAKWQFEDMAKCELARVAIGRAFAAALGVPNAFRPHGYGSGDYPHNFNTGEIANGTYLWDIKPDAECISFEVRVCPPALALKIAKLIKESGSK